MYCEKKRENRTGPYRRQTPTLLRRLVPIGIYARTSRYLLAHTHLPTYVPYTRVVVRVRNASRELVRSRYRHSKEERTATGTTTLVAHTHAHTNACCILSEIRVHRTIAVCTRTTLPATRSPRKIPFPSCCVSYALFRPRFSVYRVFAIRTRLALARESTSRA